MSLKVLNLNRVIAWLLVVVWMGLIFFLSHQPATSSSELSSGITTVIINILENLLPFVNMEMNVFHSVIRKCAHFFAYFMVGVLVANALRIKWLYFVGLSLFICVLYAISDEVHQLFIPGRSGEIKDVLIDSAGSITGIVVYILFEKWRKY